MKITKSSSRKAGPAYPTSKGGSGIRVVPGKGGVRHGSPTSCTGKGGHAAKAY